MTAEPNTSMTTDKAIAMLRDALSGWDDPTDEPDNLAALAVLTQEIERLRKYEDAVLEFRAKVNEARVLLPEHKDIQ